MTSRIAEVYYVSVVRPDNKAEPRLQIYRAGERLFDIALERGMLVKLIRQMVKVID
jgi:hypothetical protein